MFTLSICDESIQLFVVETDRYVKERNGAGAGPSSQINLSKPVTSKDMNAFVDILLLLGVTKCSSYDLNWSTDPYLEMKCFRKIMPRDKFLSILSFFHLVHNTTARPHDHPHYEKAFKSRPLINRLIPLWQNYFLPGKELSVDESMITFKGKTYMM